MLFLVGEKLLISTPYKEESILLNLNENTHNIYLKEIGFSELGCPRSPLDYVDIFNRVNSS